MSAISANMADLSRYAADVGLMSAISADMANQCRSSADVGPTCEAIWVAIAKCGSYDKNRDTKQGACGQRNNLLCSHRIVSTCRLLPATILRTACSVGRN